VPVDFETESMGQKLLENGYNKSKKTLFIVEGLVMYIPPKAVDEMLSFIVNNSAKGSEVLFDYFLQSVVDGTRLERICVTLRHSRASLFGIGRTAVCSSRNEAFPGSRMWPAMITNGLLPRGK
jgi:methyltransferase (TIGR00027 family)